MSAISSISHSQNLAIGFQRQLEADPTACALVLDDQRWTREQLGDLASRAVGTLREAGISSGCRVIAHYDTGPQDIALALACARVGATFIPIPRRMGVREINFILDRAQASIFVHSEAGPPAGLMLPHAVGSRSSDEVVAGKPLSVDIVATSNDHTALVGVTSGSTGRPKSVMHGWSGVSWAAERMRALADVQAGESIMVTGAGAGAPGFTFFTYLGMVHGVVLVRTARWDPKRVLQLARANHCVWSTMVTAMLQMLLDAREEALGSACLDDMRAVTVGGSYMSSELITRARTELGVEVLRMYAMAECMSHSSTLLSDVIDDRNTLDGRPGPRAEFAIFDDTRKRAALGEIGEVGMKGPSLLQGYLEDPDGKSKLLTEDGFFLSGDMGMVDHRGYLKIVGRKKDIINRGGFKIDPTEVEELIRSHPAVAKVVVVPYADRIFGEKVCAVVEPHSARRIEFHELIDFLRSKGLSKEKFPERLECREALPLSPDGKILRAAVQTEIANNPHVPGDASRSPSDSNG